MDRTMHAVSKALHRIEQQTAATFRRDGNLLSTSGCDVRLVRGQRFFFHLGHVRNLRILQHHLLKTSPRICHGGHNTVSRM